MKFSSDEEDDGAEAGAEASDGDSSVEHGKGKGKGKGKAQRRKVVPVLNIVDPKVKVGGHCVYRFLCVRVRELRGHGCCIGLAASGAGEAGGAYGGVWRAAQGLEGQGQGQGRPGERGGCGLAR
jgi:hypothetical protein